MKHGKGMLTERAKYVATMAALLAERAERYEEIVDKSLEENGTNLVYCGVYCGYDVDQMCSGTNLERMVVQLRAELLELGKMIQEER